MASSVPDRSWERRATPPLADCAWFDFAAPDGALAGFAALTLPAGRPGWFWAALARDGRPVVLVRDLDVPPPRSPSSREIRAEGLWADLVCETPLEHWTIGLEAFGVALDDPDEALRGERGDRVALGFDLEWETEPGSTVGAVEDYVQTAAVHGEILVGDGAHVDRLAFTGAGRRGHRQVHLASPAAVCPPSLDAAGGTVHRVVLLLDPPGAPPQVLTASLGPGAAAGQAAWSYSVSPAA